MSEIRVVTNILKANDELNALNRKELDKKSIYVINLMSSPGSGKTSILEKIISKLKAEIKIAVIEGDLYTTMDAQRIEAKGVPVVQINTGGACHLDAYMIKDAIGNLNLDGLELLIVENVGNLVCPAEFEIGEDIKVTVLSTTEGNDKPLKYPLAFEKSAAVILNKIDLLEYTDFDRQKFYDDVKSINGHAVFFETSCTKDLGLDELCTWIKNKIKEKQEILTAKPVKI
jgi:hydrogenase nickel incorporation protein HypB